MARIGRRIRQLLAQIPSGYDWVWDLCCDHGYLGLELLAQQPKQRVGFVDQLPQVMRPLGEQLQALYPAERWQCLTLDASQLILPPGKHLLVVAGVGDEVLLRIMNQLRLQQGGQGSELRQLDWLLSPANNVYLVRHQLQQWQMVMQAEGLIEERGKLYEWLILQEQQPEAAQAKLSRVSNPAPFWQPELASHRQHLSRLMRHAELVSKHQDDPLALAEWQCWQGLLNQDR